MTTPYEEIALFGLTENGSDDLPIPALEELQQRAVGEAFDALFGTLQGTGLASEIEPLAHAFATMLQRRAVALDTAADRLKMKIRALIPTMDGSEVLENELDDTTRQFEFLQEKADALKEMAETAAQLYESETGSHYTPVTGDRTTKTAMASGAVFEAKRLLDAADRAEAERNAVEGTKIAIAGDVDWLDAAPIWKRLDVALAKVPDMILCHKGAKGVEKIAADWARSRKVPQIIFRPNWAAFKKAAPFRANDEMIRAKVKGAIVFGTKSGIALNLADKLEEKAKHVSRIKGPEKTRDA
ncbi:DUF2493 domain-containing protein [Palleronia caenipelagi]|uniref:DUF2493 domain-containing protein n=1 Tax=Palleronia caenipelagi TaxID=2489174 RepID=A0A547PP07_9RHOB|nr:DUF2493 domain-containing protein [Palleronia caenipelagi]TRD15774.1 DUF2493 domain-containing protein [Palleronia caenipelagi]